MSDPYVIDPSAALFLGPRDTPESRDLKAREAAAYEAGRKWREDLDWIEKVVELWAADFAIREHGAAYWKKVLES